MALQPFCLALWPFNVSMTSPMEPFVPWTNVVSSLREYILNMYALTEKDLHRLQAYYGYFIAAGSIRYFGKGRRDLKYNNQLPVQRDEMLRRQRDRERERRATRSKVGRKTSILVGSMIPCSILCNLRLRRHTGCQETRRYTAAKEQRRQHLADETVKEREAR